MLNLENFKKKKSSPVHLGKERRQKNTHEVIPDPEIEDSEKKDILSIAQKAQIQKFTQTRSSIDFTKTDELMLFLDMYGKIKSRENTGLTAHMQRKVSKAIRKARSFHLIPYTKDIIY